MTDAALNILESMLGHVLSLIRAQPCRCSVEIGGLSVCRRCLLLRRN